MKASLAFTLVFAAYMAVGLNDQRVAQDTTRPVQIVDARPDPLNPPRCPKRNAAGELLLREVAMQADGGDWTHACEYQGSNL